MQVPYFVMLAATSPMFYCAPCHKAHFCGAHCKKFHVLRCTLLKVLCCVVRPPPHKFHVMLSTLTNSQSPMFLMHPATSPRFSCAPCHKSLVVSCTSPQVLLYVCISVHPATSPRFSCAPCHQFECILPLLHRKSTHYYIV